MNDNISYRVRVKLRTYPKLACPEFLAKFQVFVVNLMHTCHNRGGLMTMKNLYVTEVVNVMSSHRLEAKVSLLGCN